MKSLCLVMIVKNEEKVIQRCLESVYRFLDYWVICDTGSTDNTIEIIKSFFKKNNIEGELLDHKWKNFGFNRTLAIQSAYKKADYLLLMDADFVFIPKNPSFKNELSHQGYHIKYEGNLDYRQLLCVSGNFKWEYIGVTHEYLHCKEVTDITNFDGFTFDHKGDGGTRKEKFERDIKLLQDALVNDPNNTRYMFYLAQSYRDIKNYKQALKWYNKRIEKKGWEQEQYFSMYMKAECLFNINGLNEKTVKAFLEAYEFRRSRLEALHFLIRELRLKNRYEEAFRYGIRGYGIKYPDDILFVDKSIHEWKFLDELAVSAYYVGNADFSIFIYRKIQDKIPSYEKDRFFTNLKHFSNYLKEKI